MTVKEKKAILNNYRVLINRLDTIKEEYLTLESRLISPKISIIGDMPTGRSQIHDRQAEGLMNLIEIENTMINKQNEILKQINEINNAIDSLNNAKYERLLYLRYKKNYDWEVISQKMMYHKDSCYKIHGKALQKIKF
jgi:hypothetical protein